MVIAGLAAFAALVAGVRTGNLWAAVVPFLVSPVALLIIRLTLEPKGPDGLLDLRTQSWAFLLGDTFALPLVALGGVLAWRIKKMDFHPFFLSPWWIVVCLVIGAMAAYGWHFLLDGPGYIKAGYDDLLGSPSKQWHDFPVYGSLFGGLVYLAVPSLIHSFKEYGWICLVGFALWGLFGLADNTIHKLDPADLHPPKSETLLR